MLNKTEITKDHWLKIIDSIDDFDGNATFGSLRKELGGFECFCFLGAVHETHVGKLDEFYAKNSKEDPYKLSYEKIAEILDIDINDYLMHVIYDTWDGWFIRKYNDVQFVKFSEALSEFKKYIQERNV